MIDLKNTKYGKYYRKTIPEHYRSFSRQGIKNKKPIKYTKQEFIEYVFSNKDFIKLYDTWDGFDNETRPVVIRKNNINDLELTNLVFTIVSKRKDFFYSKDKKIVNRIKGTFASFNENNKIFKVPIYTKDEMVEYVLTKTPYKSLWFNDEVIPKINRDKNTDGSKLEHIVITNETYRYTETHKYLRRYYLTLSKEFDFTAHEFITYMLDKTDIEIEYIRFKTNKDMFSMPKIKYSGYLLKDFYIETKTKVIYKILTNEYKTVLTSIYHGLKKNTENLEYTKNEFVEHIIYKTKYDKLWLKYKDGLGDQPRVRRVVTFGKQNVSDLLIMTDKEFLDYKNSFTTKICYSCKKDLGPEYYGKALIAEVRVGSKCLDCNLKHRRTKEGWCYDVYFSQRESSKKRGHPQPLYTYKQLWMWVTIQPNFNRLYDNWVNSGYLKDTRPSIDRLDDNKGYSFDNIQLVTWRENYIKQSILAGKEIILTNVKTGKVNKFTSMRKAAIFLNTNKVTISNKLYHSDNTFNGYTIT